MRDAKDEDGCEPHEGEEFMGERQLDWFRARLVAWREEVVSSAAGTLVELGAASIQAPDMNDRASTEADWTRELRTRDRQRKLLTKIAAALRRIDSGEYGYCETTGEPIALARLIARPIATMTVSAQEAHERMERVSRAA